MHDDPISKLIAQMFDQYGDELTLDDVKYIEARLNQVLREHGVEPPGWLVIDADFEHHTVQLRFADPDETQRNVAEMLSSFGDLLDTIAEDPRGHGEPLDPEDLPRALWDVDPENPETFPCIFYGSQSEMGACGGLIETVTRTAAIEGEDKIVKARLCEQHREAFKDLFNA